MSLLSTIALVTASITGIGAFMYSIYRIAKRIDSAIGVDSKGRTISDRMSRVEHQLWENGGDSLKDQVNEIQKGQIEIKAEMTIIKDILVGTSTVRPKKPKIAKLN